MEQVPGDGLPRRVCLEEQENHLLPALSSQHIVGMNHGTTGTYNPLQAQTTLVKITFIG